MSEICSKSNVHHDFGFTTPFEYLQVFPDLRVWCEARRLYLVECDLRWVTSRLVRKQAANTCESPCSLDVHYALHCVIAMFFTGCP